MDRQEGYLGRYIKPRLSVQSFLQGVFSQAVIQREVSFPDVSFYQGVIDWVKMRTRTSAVLIRAGQNLWEDPQFQRNYSEAKRLGFRRGVYYFYDDRISPESQADLLISLIQNDLPEMEVTTDWENSYGGPFGGLKNVVKFMLRVENRLVKIRSGLYTGYYWFRDHSSASANPAEYDYLQTVSLHLAWYTSNPAYVLIPAPWTKLTFWQYGTPALGSEYGVQSNEIDMNNANMSQAEFDTLYPLQQVEDPGVVMETHAGVILHQIRRFGTDCYVHVIDLKKTRMQIKKGFLPVNVAVQQTGAQLGFNMGGWGLMSPVSAPNEYLIIEGTVYQDQALDGRPAIEVTRDLQIKYHLTQPNFKTSWNVWGFDRMIAQNGVYNSRITDPNSEPRTVYGSDSQGRLVILVCEGRQAGQKGLTFPEVWSVMKEFQVSTCGNADGGYSSAAVNTAFPNPLLNSTYTVEYRPTVTQLLFYATGVVQPPPGETMNYKLINPARPRSVPSVSTADRDPEIPAGTEFIGGLIQIDTITDSHPQMIQIASGPWNGKWVPLGFYAGKEYARAITVVPNETVVLKAGTLIKIERNGVPESYTTSQDVPLTKES